MFRNTSYINGDEVLCIFGFIKTTMYCIAISNDGNIEYSRKPMGKIEKILYNSNICDELFRQFLTGQIEEEFLPI